MGNGNFFMMQPDDLIANTRRTGVEMDPITGAIARALFPGSSIAIKPYQKTALPDNYYDLNIGNYPFAKHAIYDPAFKRWPYLTETRMSRFSKIRPSSSTVRSTATSDLQRARRVASQIRAGRVVRRPRGPPYGLRSETVPKLCLLVGRVVRARRQPTLLIRVGRVSILAPGLI